MRELPVSEAEADPAIKLIPDVVATSVPNVGKLGLLDANDGDRRNRSAGAALLELDFADDTATDHASHDEVARDRAAAAAVAG
jgi:hypothetical protein